jgi:hypothetical protein
MGLPRTSALVLWAAAACFPMAVNAARGDEAEGGPALARFSSLDLVDAWDGGGGGGADAPAPPANPPAPADTAKPAPGPGDAKPADLKSPTVKKMLEKGYLTPEEAAQLDKDEEARRGSTVVNSMAERLKFSGLTYFGYTYTMPTVGSNTGDFELRRNYITLEAQLSKNISFRNTLDITKETGASTGDGGAEEGSEGNLKFRVKYAYLYFNEILPASALEFGVVHRPWLDYEEHMGWLYRSIVFTFIENPDSAGIISSADLGANLKTATPYFSSEVAVVNGESYDHLDRIGGTAFNNSIEGRFTFHALANGNKKLNMYRNIDSYLNFSFNTVNNFRYNSSAPASVIGSKASANGEVDRLIYQFHAVYNNPLFLVAMQYVYNQDRFKKLDTTQDNDGASVNVDLRPMMIFSDDPRWIVFGRADYWNIDVVHGEREFYVYGIAYDLTRNVRLIVNGINADKNHPAKDDFAKVMFTTEVNW